MQTAWFMFSLATQTLGIFIIRTKETPFLKSWPSMALFLSSIFCLFVGWALPYTPLGEIFKFVPIPLNVILIIIGLQSVYLVTLEVVKKWFYRKYDY
jgi:Mg2+-importing ATPase